MSKKNRKIETIGVISGIDLLKKSRPIQDIPFRTGVRPNKKKEEQKKRRKFDKNNIEKYL